MTPIITVRPVTIIGHRFTDGESLFETASHQPIAAWAIFISAQEQSTAGLAPDRETAVAAAKKLASDNGWLLGEVALDAAPGERPQ